jgi:hypothetical protein
MIFTLYCYFVLSHFYIKLYYNFKSLFISYSNIFYHIYFILLYYFYLIFLIFFIYEFYFLSNLNLNIYLFFYNRIGAFNDNLQDIKKVKINIILFFILHYYKKLFIRYYINIVDYLKYIVDNIKYIFSMEYFKPYKKLIKDSLINFIDKSLINIKKYLIKKFYKPKIEIIFILRNKKLYLVYYYYNYKFKLKEFSKYKA